MVIKKIMILGAGSCQLEAIKRSKELGLTTYVSDNKVDSPGKLIADFPILADTFSYKETLQEAKKHNVNGIMTSGTDQPVLTLNRVAEALNIPCFLGYNTALNVTHKKFMKEKFYENNIPTAKFKFVSSRSDAGNINFNGPYVIKPVDSQGQRGIFKVDTIEEIIHKIPDVLMYSRENYLLVEAFYENKEITVSGYVHDKEVYILTVTDRVTFHSDEHIGVCVSHEYPSIHLGQYKEDIFRITQNICTSFEINEGPIYFQYLVGNKGVLVNEIACRIGGAYEDITIPMVTGVDILKLNIEGSMNVSYDCRALDHYVYKDNHICVSTQLFFCNPGHITFITDRNELLKYEFVLDLGFNYQIGDQIEAIENASQRAGFIIITGIDEDDIKNNIKIVFNKLKILDTNNINLIKKGKRWYRE